MALCGRFFAMMFMPDWWCTMLYIHGRKGEVPHPYKNEATCFSTLKIQRRDIWIMPNFIHHEKEVGATEEFCVDEAIGKSYYVQGIWNRNCNWCYALCYDALLLLIS